MDAARERVVSDIKNLLTDVDLLFRQAAAATGEEARELRRRAEDALDQAYAKFEAVQDNVIRRGRAGARATDDWVHSNPWTALGIGAGIGLLIGILIGRR